MMMIMAMMVVVTEMCRTSLNRLSDVTDLAPIYCVSHFLIASYVFKKHQVYQGAGFLHETSACEGAMMHAQDRLVKEKKKKEKKKKENTREKARCSPHKNA